AVAVSTPQGGATFLSPIPAAMTLSHIYATTDLTGGPGSGKSVTWTAKKGTTTIATCTISNSATSCSATGTATTFAAGEILTLVYATSGSPGNGEGGVGVGP